jgi:hypothetical protein
LSDEDLALGFAQCESYRYYFEEAHAESRIPLTDAPKAWQHMVGTDLLNGEHGIILVDVDPITPLLRSARNPEEAYRQGISDLSWFETRLSQYAIYRRA